MSSLPDNIQKLFRHAFVASHSTPSLRPSAEEWYNALEQLEGNLKTCLKNTQHIYYYGAKECPWCKVESAIAMKENRIIREPFDMAEDNSMELGGRISINAPDDLHTIQIKL